VRCGGSATQPTSPSAHALTPHTCADWTAKDEAPRDVKQWEDDWDDDTVSDDFAKQLRAELDKPEAEKAK
jgi:DSS1/SEM1 family